MEIKVGIGSALASKPRSYARNDPRPDLPFEDANEFWWVYPASWFACLAILALVATGYSA